MKEKVKNFCVLEHISVKDAMRQMGKVGERILFVVDGANRLLGSLTDGDIRRWVLAEGSLLASVDKVCNKRPVVLTHPYDVEKAKQIMLQKKIEWIPVLNGGEEITEVLLWDDVFGREVVLPREAIDIPVVIMAGGKGKRLDPFTRILPKPLIPIGQKAIIEVIMDKFNQYGISEFFISINSKSRMVKAYFEEINTAYKIHYLEEAKPLGTAGSLKFLQGKIKDLLLVSNCDIIIECDYSDIVAFHKAKGYDMTIIGSFRHFVIPYGICTLKDGGQLVKIEEKPEYDFLVNTGMYLLKKEVLNLIPKNQFFDMPELIQKLKENDGKIGVFPIDEKSWIDVGQWEEYRKSVRELVD